MSSLPLNITKFCSLVVTGGSGILALLTEFKDAQKKITLWGKVALIGIIIGFLANGVSSILENAQAQKAEEAHEREIRRLLQPLGAMSIGLTFQVVKEKQLSGPLKDLRDLLVAQSKPNQNPTATINHQDLPPELRKGLMKVIENIEQIWVDLFHKASCDPLPALPSADVALYPSPFGLGESRNAFWSYDQAGSITYVRTLYLRPFIRNTEIASVEDIHGSTIVTNSPSFSEPELTFESFIFNVADGVRFIAKSSDMKKDQDNYCYTFKPEQ